MQTQNRIKYLRKQILNNITQEEFANRIGISRSNLGGIETGRVNLTDRVAKDICDEFKINYLWLTEGEGEPKTETLEDVFEDVRKEYDLTSTDVEILREYVELKPEERKELVTYIKALINTKKEG